MKKMLSVRIVATDTYKKEIATLRQHHKDPVGALDTAIALPVSNPVVRSTIRPPSDLGKNHKPPILSATSI